jgi:hypothetical protein
MRKIATITVVVLATAMLTASMAIAGGKSNQNATSLDITKHFAALDTPDIAIGDSVGTATLTRRDDGLTATAKVEGLKPGGVYTFWWIVSDDFADFPEGVAAVGDGARVIGKSGKATVRMNVDLGDPSIEGFFGAKGWNGEPKLGGGLWPAGPTSPFDPTFDFNPDTAEVHIEIAYHGQKEDAGGNIGKWRSDFWTGEACPEGQDPIYNPGGTEAPYNVVNHIGDPPAIGHQPHCPVSYAAVFTS